MQKQSLQPPLTSLVDVSMTSEVFGVFDPAAGRGGSGLPLRGLSLLSGRSRGATGAGGFKSGLGAEVAVLLLILIMVAALCLGMHPTMSKSFEEKTARVGRLIGGLFSDGQAQTETRPASALLVSSQERDYVRVVGTLSPRGVPVVRAPDASAVLRIFSDGQFSAGMLVVDGEVPEMKNLVQQFKQRFPEGTVLVLQPDRDPAMMAAALMTYAERVHRP